MRNPIQTRPASIADLTSEPQLSIEDIEARLGFLKAMKDRATGRGRDIIDLQIRDLEQVLLGRSIEDFHLRTHVGARGHAGMEQF